MNKETYLPLSKLNFELVTPCRQGLHKEALTKYEQVLENAGGAWDFPPATVAKIGTSYYVLDGQHRIKAGENKGLSKVLCTVIEMTDLNQAKRYALCANAQHGEKLTREEIRANIREYLLCGGAVESDSKIASTFGVSRVLVADIRNNADGKSKEDKRIEAVQAVIDETPTASIHEISKQTGLSRQTVRTKLQAIKSKTEKVLVDCNGHEIPQDHTPRVKMMWQAIATTKGAIGGMKDALKDLAEAGLFGTTQDADIISTAIKQIESVLTTVKPDALCTCRGDGCRRCSGVGFLSATKYNILVPEPER